MPDFEPGRFLWGVRVHKRGLVDEKHGGHANSEAAGKAECERILSEMGIEIWR